MEGKNWYLLVALSFVVLAIIIGAYFLTQNKKVPEKSQQVQSQQVQTSDMKLTSSAFENNQDIPTQYTCDGDNVNPPLTVLEVPPNSVSLALIIDDPDAPAGTWIHWVVINIDPKTRVINENSVPQGATEGVTSFGQPGYGGLCPPSGTHRYFFKLYALDSTLNLSSNAEKSDVEKAMSGHILAKAELMGTYTRNK